MYLIEMKSKDGDDKIYYWNGCKMYVSPYIVRGSGNRKTLNMKKKMREFVKLGYNELTCPIDRMEGEVIIPREVAIVKVHYNIVSMNGDCPEPVSTWSTLDKAMASIKVEGGEWSLVNGSNGCITFKGVDRATGLTMFVLPTKKRG